MAASQQNLSCTDLKNGRFYCYPKNSTDRFIYTRNGEFQTERNTVTGDTLLWKVSWLNDCVYSLKFISGNGKMTGEVLDFLESHKMVTKIETVTNDYVVYKTYIDKASGNFITADTMWFNEQSNTSASKLFEQIPNNVSMKKLRFADTSSYALLYVFRPGKLAGSLGEYFLYFDDNILCVSKNRSAYTFKIFTTGTHKLSAKLFNQKEIMEKIEIKAGQKYYVKAGLKFTATSLSGWRPDIIPVDEEKGSEAFLDAQ